MGDRISALQWRVLRILSDGGRIVTGEGGRRGPAGYYHVHRRAGSEPFRISANTFTALNRRGFLKRSGTGRGLTQAFVLDPAWTIVRASTPTQEGR